MIEWFAKNPVAANLLMFGIILAGLTAAIRSVPVETFPSREVDTVSIRTQFRGATPQTVEDGITLRIEEAIADIEGIKELRSRSQEGSSTVIAEVAEGYDSRNLLDDIKVRVDALNTLPNDAENPIASLVAWNPTVIFVVIQGDVNSKTLRETANEFRNLLLRKNGVSNVQLQGLANFQMNIEVSPQILDQYNMSLNQIASAIRQGASDVPAGTVQTRNGDILIRSDGQAYSAREFADIPVLTNDSGKPITLGEVARIDDGFEEKSLITTFNGEPAVLVEVRRVGGQSAIEVSALTKQTMAEIQPRLPQGVSIDYWDDDSEYLQTRISAVVDSAIWGAVLVIILLSLFLRPAVAFWVFLGIPVSFMGAFLFMPQVGGTINVISLFAFIMVIGIVVDDAIVTGENIYRKIRKGHDPLDAAILGTKEITVPVTFGILTTVVAFLPLTQLQGTQFHFLGSQMPMVVIPVLLMSLVESKLVLPSHMSHIKPRNEGDKLNKLGQIQQGISRGLEKFVENRYRPFLIRCLENKAITITVLLSVSAVIIAAIFMGNIKYHAFPRVESDTVKISFTLPETSSFETVHRHTLHISEQFQFLQEKYRDPETGKSIIVDIRATSGGDGRSIGANIGSVRAAIQPEEERTVNLTATQIAREAKKLVGEIPGAQSLTVRSRRFRGDAPINIELSGAKPSRLYEVILLLKEQLKTYPGIFDIQDNYSGGKEELKLYLKPRAASLGLRLEDVARQVRSALFGVEAQRIQRGRDELRVMVRYPIDYRSSMQDLLRLPIQVANGSEEVLLGEIAEVQPYESPSTLYRLNRKSILNITSDINEDISNSSLVLNEIDDYMQEVLQNYPDVNYRFDGEAEENAKTNARLLLGVILVLVGIYALLAIPFKSYGQPLIVMSIIPFSVIGAVMGHLITFQSLTILSIFGVLALVGVVVNDSLVLVDYINKRRQRGIEMIEAIVEAASIRFRPVLLTSITTFAGLTPILLDSSRQAKWLKPMATSLGFGIVFATLITLIIIPINYVLAKQVKVAMSKFGRSLAAFWNKPDAPANG